MKLALTSGYDSNGRMKERNGNYIQDITPLLLHALSPGRSLKGMDRFVQLLHEAGVLPEEVININVKEMLDGLHKKKTMSPNPKHFNITTEHTTVSHTNKSSQQQNEVGNDTNAGEGETLLPLPPPLIPMVPPDDPRLIAEESKRKKQMAEEMDFSKNLKRKRNQDESLEGEEPSTKKFAWDTLGH